MVVSQNLLEKWIKNHAIKEDESVEQNNDSILMVAEPSSELH